LEKGLIAKNVCVMNKIKIYNKKLGAEINIDDSVEWVTISPFLGSEPKHIRIIFDGFDFLRHSRICKDCKDFSNSFGQIDLDWFLDYNGRKFKLNMEAIGKGGFGENEIKHSNGYYEYGTNMVLSVLELDMEELERKRSEVVHQVNYEQACSYRDLISELKNE